MIRRISYFAVFTSVALLAGAAAAQTSSSARITLRERSGGCNDVGNDLARCVLGARLTDRRGRPLGNQPLQLFQRSGTSVNGFSAFSNRTRTTNSGGNARFDFQTPDERTCFQVRAASGATGAAAGASSNELCIGDGDTPGPTVNATATPGATGGGRRPTPAPASIVGQPQGHQQLPEGPTGLPEGTADR